VSSHRPPDAGTRNEWTFVGEGKVFVFAGGLPTVLGRPAKPSDGVVLVRIGHGPGAQAMILSPHQARALMEVLPAAAHAEQGDA
jgi:hypothetical protein